MTARQGVPFHRCNCESSECGHPYMSAPAGDRRAMYVGRVCDDCAGSHMAPYLIPDVVDPIALRGRGVFVEVEAMRQAQREAEHLDDNQAEVDDRIARHEEFLASEGADHLFRE